jgi:hypothetical protein
VGEDHAEQQLPDQVGHAAVRPGDRGDEQTGHEDAAEQHGPPSAQHEEGGQNVWGSESRRRGSRGVLVLVDGAAGDVGAQKSVAVEVVAGGGLPGGVRGL